MATGKNKNDASYLKLEMMGFAIGEVEFFWQPVVKLSLDSINLSCRRMQNSTHRSDIVLFRVTPVSIIFGVIRVHTILQFTRKNSPDFPITGTTSYRAMKIGKKTFLLYRDNQDLNTQKIEFCNMEITAESDTRFSFQLLLAPQLPATRASLVGDCHLGSGRKWWI